MDHRAWSPSSKRQESWLKPVKIGLWCTLEELYNGVRKKMKITREVVDEATFGKTKKEEEILTIDVMPGWKQGTLITFKKRGGVLLDPIRGMVTRDLVIVLVEKRHKTFKRVVHDLIMKKEISLAEALGGCRFDIGTLDGRTLTISLDEIVHQKYQKVVLNEGMPLAKDPGKYGDLFITFEVTFPKQLSIEQKTGLKMLLGENEFYT